MKKKKKQNKKRKPKRVGWGEIGIARGTHATVPQSAYEGVEWTDKRRGKEGSVVVKAAAAAVKRVSITRAPGARLPW